MEVVCRQIENVKIHEITDGRRQLAVETDASPI